MRKIKREVGFMEYYTRAFQNYVNFNGRDTRKQYWMFVLINIVISAAVGIVCSLVFNESVASGIDSLYGLVLLLPSLGMVIRRLHDVGRSGWWYLLVFTIIGGIVVFIFLCLPSQEGENKYGPQPEG
jgi:uncharacterized membrane protein YhaH (DUF805 family)